MILGVICDGRGYLWIDDVSERVYMMLVLEAWRAVEDA